MMTTKVDQTRLDTTSLMAPVLYDSTLSPKMRDIHTNLRRRLDPACNKSESYTLIHLLISLLFFLHDQFKFRRFQNFDNL